MSPAADTTPPAAPAALRVAAVLDGGGGGADRAARALAGFLRGGLNASIAAQVTVVVHDDPGAVDRLVAAAPTADVRLLQVPPHRPDLTAAALTAFAAGGGADLFVFAAGPHGTEAAARLAARTGGGVVTAVLDAAADPDGLTCRRPVYSGHLTGRLTLRPRPWCLVLDASWDDAAVRPSGQHNVEGTLVVPATEASSPAPFTDVEVLVPPPTGDLESAEFVIVAGRGAGREGVQRIAAAAARMGAAFGATRPVVMNGWAPMDRLVGVSGTRTSPAVCVTAGAHGAPALLWGIERAGFIAGVDSDESAPIAAAADAVVVDDAVAVIEALAGFMGADRRSP